MRDCVTTCEFPFEITCLADILNNVFNALPRIDVNGFPPAVFIDYLFARVSCSDSIWDDSLMSCIRLSKAAKPVVSILLSGLRKISIKGVFD